MKRRTLIKAGAALVALGAVGGGVGVTLSRRRSQTITEPWPELGPNVHWLRPNLRKARMVVPDRPHSKQEQRQRIDRSRTFFVNSNADRLRGGSLPAKSGRRLLAIGDSVTFGWGVADEQSYPAQLEALLRGGGADVQVLNAGVPAQSLYGMATFLERKGPALELDGVLWTRRLQLNLPQPEQDYRRHLDAAQRALPGVPFMVLLPPISRFDPYGTEQYASEGAALRRVLELPVLELTDPLWAAQTGGASLQVGPQELVLTNEGQELARVARSPHDLPQELYTLFDEDPALKEHLFFDSGHPDAEGFGVFVKAVAEQLEESGWMG